MSKPKGVRKSPSASHLNGAKSKSVKSPAPAAKINNNKSEKSAKKHHQQTQIAETNNRAASRSLNSTDYKFLTILTVFAVFVRFRKLSQPSSVVFDEVHFGGFARKYIIGRFFMDVHPPLAKMLFAVVGYLVGYDGEFEFKTIGLDYISNNVPYIGMRMMPATLGVLTILLAYSTLRASGCRSITALFGAALMTIDNALTTQSRFILLDSPLVFFIALTAYGFVKFRNETPMRFDWYRYLFLTGLALGATLSSKWVGLFTVGWVGVITVWQLWWILGDLSVSPKNYIKHFFARAVLLIGVPLAFYMAMFALHFVCLTNNGDGASFMSPEFQSTLQHSPLVGHVPADVAYGSSITLRHINTNGGYLHSHPHPYETGSKQQQVTLYPHRDNNNDWLVENITVHPSDFADVNPVIKIKDGDLIRLKHVATGLRLHSHDVRPPVTEQDYQNEVSAYGFEGFDGDMNDDFRVEIVKERSRKGVAQERLRVIDTKFRLVHQLTGCVLFSHNVKLPKWGFEQQEVVCVRGASFENSLWMVEEHSHPQLVGVDVEQMSYRTPSFLSKFIELNRVMWEVNAGLTDTHTWQSRPESWPLMLRGINFWVKDHRQVYLIGNGVIWWTMSAFIGVFGLFKLFQLLRWQRRYPNYTGAEFEQFDEGATTYILGWAFHYFPSFLMARQLFLHHYLGSVYFGILALAQGWDFLTFRLIKSRIVSYTLMALYFAAATGFFVWYSPLIYGSPWTKELCQKSTFLDMDFDCNAFLNTFEEYDQLEAGPGDVEATPAPTEYKDVEDIVYEQVEEFDTPENAVVFEEAIEEIIEEHVEPEVVEKVEEIIEEHVEPQIVEKVVVIEKEEANVQETEVEQSVTESVNVEASAEVKSVEDKVEDEPTAAAASESVTEEDDAEEEEEEEEDNEEDEDEEEDEEEEEEDEEDNEEDEDDNDENDEEDDEDEDDEEDDDIEEVIDEVEADHDAQAHDETVEAAKQPAEEAQPNAEKSAAAGVSSAPEPPQATPSAKYEYRDENGNILPKEQVESLVAAGKLNVEKRYRAGNKYYDAQGNEVKAAPAKTPEQE
ncbi:hypothetical protein DV113_000348 [Geotrichum candidum]|uniref:dolichyl-phosphate-mannose--protein mannosyltransferase n=1 Tax=Geotrichum candidum TaxID=1173061 RepID=A0A0J9XC46_GEOCN|nr:hypothetical protein DV113_000348 [Geotrichum candidum]CDO54877.1 similar to Saccharomyces cerevisiae YDL095W PMT1 Protein O-mannosyltransferase [Geotrichum candidum]